MRDFSDVGITDNFMFGYIMRDELICRMFLEMILDMKIDKIVHIDREKTIDEKIGTHGVRLDICAEDGTRIFNCEMQTVNHTSLPKRARYYQGQLDISSLEKGALYSTLKPTYIIFICISDPFHEDQYIYSFENVDTKHDNMILGDEAYKIFVNINGHKGNVSESFRELMEFFRTSEKRSHTENKLVNCLYTAVCEARRSRDWREAYMTWERFGEEMKLEGREEGRKEGRVQGHLDIAINLLKRGFTVEQVSDITGISVESLKTSISEGLVCN